MTNHFDFVIVGGGLAGVTAAETLRNEGAQGRVLLLTQEAYLPYQRPPLSKKLLLREEPPQPSLILSASKYQELSIDVRLGALVTSVQPLNQTLRTLTHELIHYKKLLIATGVKPTRLAIPGEYLQGVYHLRTLLDAQAIWRTMQHARHAVVIGGSLMGLEVAATLRQKGLEVTLIERDSVLEKLSTPEISVHFQQKLEAQGIQVLVSDMPRSFEGRTVVESVTTAAGKTIPCELVVVAAGVEPDIHFLKTSGLKLDNGVRVDRFLCTNNPHVFAAGDVANFQDEVFHCQHRVEHWDNAVKQGRVAARNMLGQHLPYAEVSYFYSHVFDQSFTLLGVVNQHAEKIERGSLAEGSYASFFLKNDIPRGLFALGRPTDEIKVTETLIKHRVNLHALKHELSNPDFRLNHIPNQTIFILQGGGAFGAFECGAVSALDAAGVRPDIVAGISIGAFNGAIIAGNPHDPASALKAFWRDLALVLPEVPEENLRRFFASQHAVWFGVPNFFKPRWLMSTLKSENTSARWPSFYDLTPAKALLTRYVDFSQLKRSPIRLLIQAVDVQTGELAMFDSYIDDLKPEHVLASGSLPPAFAWTSIGGKRYWDAGIVSNSPLEDVLARCGSAGKRVFIIDLFPGKRSLLPQNLLDVMGRRDEIVYAERIHTDLRMSNLVRDYQRLVEEIVHELPADAAKRIQHQPRFIQMMGGEAPMAITRIVREHSGHVPFAKSYDFSLKTVEQLIHAGYRMAKKAIGL